MTTYTLTQVQIDALNALPPGFYLVCAGCGRFSEGNTTIHFESDGPICDTCSRWGRGWMR